METSRKTVIIYIILGPNYRTDHWGIFRGEGRICINIGFGLAELGYDVDLINSEFKSISLEFNNTGKVTLSPIPTKEHYDFALYFGGIDSNIEANKLRWKNLCGNVILGLSRSFL